MKKNVSRQVRYNKRACGKNPDKMEWWFLIVNNDEREFERIRNKIYGVFAPIEEQEKTLTGKLSKNSMNYCLIKFQSGKKVEYREVKKLYQRVLMDTNLYNRRNADGLVKYIESIDD